MAEEFDPYLKWLGIPLKDRPIDHYRLLAIERFESDSEVITNAADQRMAHLKNFATGKHAKQQPPWLMLGVLGGCGVAVAVVAAIVLFARPARPPATADMK